MHRFATNPMALVRSIVSHWDLVTRLVGRDYQMRFRGSSLGLFWAILTPLMTAGVFTFVFSSVFAARWDATVAGPFDFALIFMVGLAVHSIFSEVVARAPTLMLSNASYVTKVVFPLEILSLVTLLTALLTAGINIAIVVLLQLVLNWQISPMLICLPFVLMPYLIFVLAIGLLIAAVGVYLRDLSQGAGLLITITMFLSPIFYPVDAVPEQYRFWMWLNPLTFIMQEARAVTLFDRWPNFYGLGLYTACSLVLLWFAFWLFQRLRIGFADVL